MRMALIGVLLVSGAAFASGTAGSLDTAFGTGGFVTTTSEGYVEAAAHQSDGRLVVLGSDGLEAENWRLRRYIGDGSLDLDVGVTVPGAMNSSFGALGVDGSDRIYLAGTATMLVVTGKGKKPKTSLVEGLAVVRMTAVGTMDASFGDGGVAFAEVGSVQVAAVAVDAAGPVVFGSVRVGSGRRNRGGGTSAAFLLVRFDASGSVVSGFGQDGVLIDDITNSDERPIDLAIDGAGRIVVAGHTGDSDWHVRRYLGDGTLDGSFGPIDGAAEDFLRGIAVDASGRVLAAGWRWHGSDSSEGVVARYGANGTLDADFAVGGIWLSGAPVREEFIDVDVDAGGSILVGGHHWEVDGSSFDDLDLVVYRLDVAGDPDPDYGTGGMGDLTSPGATAIHGAFVFVVDADGNATFGGQHPADVGELGTAIDWLLVRYCAN